MSILINILYYCGYSSLPDSIPIFQTSYVSISHFMSCLLHPNTPPPLRFLLILSIWIEYSISAVCTITPVSMIPHQIRTVYSMILSLFNDNYRKRYLDQKASNSPTITNWREYTFCAQIAMEKNTKKTWTKFSNKSL